MTTSNVLGVLGILATIVFGIWGLVVVLRRRYPGEISFVHEPHLPLFEAIIKNLPELTAQYDNTPVGPGLILVRGALLNSGTKDISDPMVERKLTFELPERFKWLTAKVIATSPNVEASVVTDEHTLTFSTGLFRCSEFIRFQAIAEVPLTDPKGGTTTDTKLTEQLDKAIRIDHRIADTRPVARIDLPRQPKRRSAVSRAMLNALAMTAVLFAMCGVLAFQSGGLPAELHFIINTTNTAPDEVLLEPQANGFVKAKAVNSKYREKLPVKTFFDTYHPTAKISPMHHLKLLAGMLLGWLALGWGMCGYEYIDRRKAIKIRRLLDMDSA